LPFFTQSRCIEFRHAAEAIETRRMSDAIIYQKSILCKLHPSGQWHDSAWRGCGLLSVENAGCLRRRKMNCAHQFRKALPIVQLGRCLVQSGFWTGQLISLVQPISVGYRLNARVGSKFGPVQVQGGSKRIQRSKWVRSKISKISAYWRRLSFGIMNRNLIPSLSN